MKKILALVGLVLGASEASALVYDCSIDGRFARGWMSDRVIIGLDGPNGENFVFDGAVQAVYGEPIAPTIRSERGNEITLTWDVENVPSTSGRDFDLRYTGFFDKDALTINILARLRASDQIERGNGTCVITN